MGKHISALYSPVQMGLPGQGGDTFEYIRYSFPEFVHYNDPAIQPRIRDLYTKGFWLDPHPASGRAAFGGSVDGSNGLFIRSPFTDEVILAVADVPLSDMNVSLVLTDKREVYAQAYSGSVIGAIGGGLTGEYVSVFDENWGAVTSPPQFLEIAALVDSDNQEIHAITLAVESNGRGRLFDWFGGVPFGNDLGSWTLIPFLLTSIPGGRLVTASYSPSLQEREILVATSDSIQLIRSTRYSTQQENFASFTGSRIISLTSFSVPDDTDQRAIVATTGDDLVYQLWEISYGQSVAQPHLIGTIEDFSLLEISGYANPVEQLRHLALISSSLQLYRGSYNPNGGGFQYSSWPDLPLAVS